jgi:hypothetical protein
MRKTLLVSTLLVTSALYVEKFLSDARSVQKVRKP